MKLSFIKSIKVLITLFLLLIVFFVYLGYSYYQNSKKNEIIERSEELKSISNLLSNSITTWRLERFADAEYLFNNVPLKNLVHRYLKSGSQFDSLEIVSAISTMYKNHDYSNICIRNLAGDVIISMNAARNIFVIKDSLDSAIKNKKIVFSDLYYDSKTNSPTIDIYYPLIYNRETIGAIIMNIDPSEVLFPIITGRYVDRSSGESFLVKLENDSVIFLSPLKYLSGGHGLIKKSIYDEELLSSKVFEDSEKIIKGNDYRGTSVIADIRPLKNSAWYLVTKLDESEILAPVNESALTDVFIFGLISFLGGLLLLYYHTRINFNSLKKISETENKLKDILDYSTNAFYSHTPNHVLTYTSPQFLTILGYTEEELKVKWTTLATDNQVNLKGFELTNRAIETGKAQPPYELELVKKNGDFVWVEVREAPVVKNGKTIKIVGSLTDITQRKQFEEKLKILSKAVEQSTASVVITDPKGNIQYVNTAFTLATGYTLREVFNSNPRILKSGHQSEKIYKDLWDTILSGKTWQGELHNKKKDGSFFWENVIISPITNGGGRISNFVAIKEDITGKKIQEAILKENEEKFRLVFDNSNEALILTRPDGTFDAVNPAACRMFQYSAEELIKKGRDKIIDKSDPRFEEFLKNKSESNQTSGELTFIRKNGEKFLGEFSSTIFKDKDGNLRTSTIVRDITERNKYEQEIIKAKEKAEEASQIKSNFLATMSHELRTPLVGILGYAELLSGELKNAEQVEMADTILLSGQRLLETLNSILDLSRIEANKIEFTSVSVDLLSVIEESVKLFKPVAVNKHLSIEIVFPYESIFIKSDKDLLLKIFNNLISNAVKYTSRGGIVVKASTQANGVKSSVAIDVIDTGIGISSENHNIVFEPFRQVSEGLSRVFEGTGLGLAVSKRLVEILNGKISFASVPGKGSTFTVVFPVSEIKMIDEDSSEQESVFEDKDTQAKLSKDKSVLIVEDDFSNAVMIKTYLEEFITADHVYNGYEAIDKCKHKKYDAVLMDINLRGIDGVETFRRIREIDDYYFNVPIIAVTAYAMKGDKERFLSAGFNYYIPKPFKQAELLNILQKVIEK